MTIRNWSLERECSTNFYIKEGELVLGMQENNVQVKRYLC
jgi:hypothetical protein